MEPKLTFTTGFLAVCIVVFVFGFFRGAADGAGAVPMRFALYGPAVSDGQWWRIFTTVFVHAGVLHLFMNGSALYTLGNQLEGAIGGSRLAAVSLACALGAATFVLLFGYGRPTIGASGVICGYLGAMLPIATRAGRRWIWLIVLQIAIISLLPFVSWQGHLGGFLFGLPAGLALRVQRRLFPIAMGALLILSLWACREAAMLRGAFSL